MIETSSPTQPGDRARLESIVFDGTNGYARCFRFWYHMYGDAVGSLNIYLFNGSFAPLWSLSGNRGNEWYEGQVSYSSSIPYQIVIEGIAGHDFLVGLNKNSVLTVEYFYSSSREIYLSMILHSQ